MLGFRVKMGPTRSKEWSCCFGLHVRTATIMIGMWSLFVNILSLALLAIIIRNPTMIRELLDVYDDSSRINDQDAPALPTPLSKIDPPYAYRDYSFAYHNIEMGGIVCVCMIGISLMLIYGAVKYKPSHLLPYFCLQLFYFAITTLTAASNLCYLRPIHSIVNENHHLPWRDELLKMSPQILSVLVLLMFIAVVLLKAYAIGIVWRCYKYLTIRQHNLRSMLPYIIPDMSARQERDYNTLLPDYEEAIAQGMKHPPPPYYQVVLPPNVSATTSIVRPDIVVATTSGTYPPSSVTSALVINPEITPPTYNESIINTTNVTSNTESSVK